MIVQPHGGALLARGKAGNKGGGRPKEEIRAQLRDLAFGKGIPFLKRVLDGEIPVDFVGTCPHCNEESHPSAEQLSSLLSRIVQTSEHQLRANEQALRFGVGTQNESLDPEEGKAYFQKVLGRMVDELTALGVPLTTSKAAYVAAAEGL